LRYTGFRVISDVANELTMTKEEGKEVLAWDNGHWNEKGHEVVGKAVARYLASTYSAQ
jgi:hypothetical protein